MPILTIGSLLGFFAVGLGAFGAHGLEGRITEQGLEWWHTATLYALTHAIVITAMGLATRSGLSGFLIPAIFMTVGVLIFAGTLYSMALGAPRWFGAITPIGGVSLLIGWGWLAFVGLSASRTG
ncbi:MAG: DUF423 domain-containing protein [Ponticaulis sp.]|nr:DUF423 domain-containing protein [Ponticaulis sp.]